MALENGSYCIVYWGYIGMMGTKMEATYPLSYIGELLLHGLNIGTAEKDAPTPLESSIPKLPPQMIVSEKLGSPSYSKGHFSVQRELTSSTSCTTPHYTLLHHFSTSLTKQQFPIQPKSYLPSRPYPHPQEANPQCELSQGNHNEPPPTLH